MSTGSGGARRRGLPLRRRPAAHARGRRLRPHRPGRRRRADDRALRRRGDAPRRGAHVAGASRHAPAGGRGRRGRRARRRHHGSLRGPPSRRDVRGRAPFCSPSPRASSSRASCGSSSSAASSCRPSSARWPCTCWSDSRSPSSSARWRPGTRPPYFASGHRRHPERARLLQLHRADDDGLRRLHGGHARRAGARRARDARRPALSGDGHRDAGREPPSPAAVTGASSR